MYYDENNYLNGEEEALKEIDRLKWNEIFKRIVAKRKYGEVFDEYYKYIDRICKMISTLGLKDPIEYSHCISYLINNSYLSCEEFMIEENPKVEIDVKPGINIVLGNGCCRHHADFQKDIMDKLNIYCKKYYCYDSSAGSRKKARTSEANHVLNLINYNNTLYGIDLYNHNILYYFINNKTLKNTSYYFTNYLIYKPYVEIVYSEGELEDIKKTYEMFEKESNKKHMDNDDYDILKYENKIFFDSISDMFLDFSNENNEIKKNISELVLKKSIDKK